MKEASGAVTEASMGVVSKALIYAAKSFRELRALSHP